MIPALLSVALAAPWADEPPATWRSITGQDVTLRGFHFQIVFGLGGGPKLDGLFHAMEIGGTFGPGVTLALLHTFIQNKGILGPERGPDLIGGWLLEAKVPLTRPEIVAKFAVGPGGRHVQGGGRIQALWGPTFAYGVDFQLPVTRRSGPTLALTGMHTFVQGEHLYGFGAGLGYTVF